MIMIFYTVIYQQEMLSGGLCGMKFRHVYRPAFKTIYAAEQKIKEFIDLGIMTDYRGVQWRYSDVTIGVVDTDCPNCMAGDCDHSLLPAPIDNVVELGYN